MIAYLQWIFIFHRCKHLRRRGIYGDEIIALGWHRGACLDCPALFKAIPDKEYTHRAIDSDEIHEIAKNLPTKYKLPCK